MGNIHLSIAGDCATLEISNPSKANALDLQMLGQLELHVDRLEAETGLRLVTVKGKAAGVFCSGADISDWSAMPSNEFGTDWLTRGNKLFDRLVHLPCLTVSVIEGLCFGGGLELALCTDMRVATMEASFCFPEVGIGTFPGWMGGPRLAALVGRGRALEMALLGQPISAVRAHDFGLVNHLVDAEHLEHFVSNLKDRTYQLSSIAMHAAKGAFFAYDLLHYHEQTGINLRESSDAKEGVRAFLEKRKPNFEVKK